MQNVLNLIFELHQLKRIKRSGGHILNADLGSLADHSYMVSMIGLILAYEQRADVKKVLLMSLIHDIPEVRTGDANFVQKRYQVQDENDALNDQLTQLGSATKQELTNLFYEYKEQKTLESKIVKEADILEQMICEKVEYEKGNTQAEGWMNYSFDQLKTKFGKEVGKKILTGNSFDWWQSLHKKPLASTLLK